MAKHEGGERHSRKRAREMLTKAGYKSGGHLHTTKKLIGEAVHEHEGALHKHEKKTPIRLKDGGCAEGRAMGGRPDRKPRGAGGGKKGGHTTVNVVVPHSAPQTMPVPVPHPMPMPPPQGAAPGGAPPMGPPKPPGAMPPPGMGGMKKGGHVKKMKGYPIKDGGGGGEGRLEKAKAYGARV
ncbi:MAG TPA: hypothetical protein VGG45_16240 [Terracidiphilus sp.]|jgi:hypothetical protein